MATTRELEDETNGAAATVKEPPLPLLFMESCTCSTFPDHHHQHHHHTTRSCAAPEQCEPPPHPKAEEPSEEEEEAGEEGDTRKKRQCRLPAPLGENEPLSDAENSDHPAAPTSTSFTVSHACGEMPPPQLGKKNAQPHRVAAVGGEPAEGQHRMEEETDAASISAARSTTAAATPSLTRATFSSSEEIQDCPAPHTGGDTSSVGPTPWPITTTTTASSSTSTLLIGPQSDTAAPVTGATTPQCPSSYHHYHHHSHHSSVTDQLCTFAEESSPKRQGPTTPLAMAAVGAPADPTDTIHTATHSFIRTEEEPKSGGGEGKTALSAHVTSTTSDSVDGVRGATPTDPPVGFLAGGVVLPFSPTQIPLLSCAAPAFPLHCPLPASPLLLPMHLQPSGSPLSPTRLHGSPTPTAGLPPKLQLSRSITDTRKDKKSEEEIENIRSDTKQEQEREEHPQRGEGNAEVEVPHTALPPCHVQKHPSSSSRVYATGASPLTPPPPPPHWVPNTAVMVAWPTDFYTAAGRQICIRQWRGTRKRSRTPFNTSKQVEEEALVVGDQDRDTSRDDTDDIIQSSLSVPSSLKQEGGKKANEVDGDPSHREHENEEEKTATITTALFSEAEAEAEWFGEREEIDAEEEEEEEEVDDDEGSYSALLALARCSTPADTALGFRAVMYAMEDISKPGERRGEAQSESL